MKFPTSRKFWPLVLCLTACAWGQTDPWEPLGQSQPFRANSVCILRSGTMLAASPNGIFCSQDSGKTWIVRNGDIADTTVNVIAADSGGIVYAGVKHGLYRSTDEGIHWQSVAPGDVDVCALAFASPLTVYAETNAQGMIASTDRGLTWTILPSPPVPSPSLVVNEKGFLFQAYGNNYTGYVQRSTDGGHTWTNVCTNQFGFTALAEGKDHRLYAGKPMEIVASNDDGDSWSTFTGLTLFQTTPVALLPGSHGTFYAAGDNGGIYLSSDTGATWLNVTLGSAVSSILTLVEDSTGNVFAGTNAGVFISRDFGHTWNRDSSDFRSSTVCSFAITPSGTIFAGTNLGVYRSRDKGKTWVRTIRPMPRGGMGYNHADCLLYDRAGTLFAWYPLGGVAATTDEGGSWFWTPLVDTTTTCIELDTSSFLLGGDQRGPLSRSRDEGAHFQVIATCPDWNSISALRVTPDGEIIMGTEWGGVYRSKDDGRSWTNSGLTQAYVRVLLLLPGGGLMAGTGQGVFRWTDSLSGWQAKNNGMIPDMIYSLVRAPSGTIVVAGFTGIYYSEDEGDHWLPLNDGLSNITVLSLAFDAKGNLLAGTNNGAYFKTTLLGVKSPAPAVPDRFELSQNYPNPFNPSTTIRYSLPHREFVTLTLYNILGERIRTLVGENQEAGYHDVRFDAAGLASGVYYYRLTAGALAGVKPMLLLR